MSENLRTGKWTEEEELYTQKMIELFLSGKLQIQPEEGRSLRAYLARKLNCSPMRISKKFSELDFLGVWYQQVEFNKDILETERHILERYESSYLLKDVETQSRRLRRRKYYGRAESENSFKKRKTTLCFNPESEQNILENSYSVEKGMDSEIRYELNPQMRPFQSDRPNVGLSIDNSIINNNTNDSLLSQYKDTDRKNESELSSCISSDTSISSCVSSFTNLSSSSTSKDLISLLLETAMLLENSYEDDIQPL
mmetsp:Transcript_37235/g.37921  ORF Transcript_37235/g.37921 Transcript_37235/m.37921 type:complete len:254 (-) Transcript_37235:347-1108(-)